MSGGRFNYDNDNAAREMFGWEVDICYGLDDEEQLLFRKIARKINPMHDKEVSELVYDVFCLIHSLDWYLSCDTSEETYKNDLQYFKRKWFKQPRENRLKNILEETINDVREELIEMIGFVDSENETDN